MVLRLTRILTKMMNMRNVRLAGDVRGSGGRRQAEERNLYMTPCRRSRVGLFQAGEITEVEKVVNK